MQFVSIESIKKSSIEKTYDILNNDERSKDNEGNFSIDNIIVHNSIPEYVRRRDSGTNEWEQEIPEEIVKHVRDTYGVFVYQEQVSNVLMDVANFSAPYTQYVRKALAKKKTEILTEVEKKWINGAAPKIGEDAARQIWEEKIQPHGRYSFNRCLDGSTPLENAKTGEIKTIEEWCIDNDDLHLFGFDEKTGSIITNECVGIHDNGIQEVFEIEFENGETIKTTMGHKFMCDDGKYHTVKEIVKNDLNVKEFCNG